MSADCMQCVQAVTFLKLSVNLNMRAARLPTPEYIYIKLKCNLKMVDTKKSFNFYLTSDKISLEQPDTAKENLKLFNGESGIHTRKKIYAFCVQEQ